MKLKVFLNCCGIRLEVGLNSVHTRWSTARARNITDAAVIATAATCGVPESKVWAMFSEIEEGFSRIF